MTQTTISATGVPAISGGQNATALSGTGSISGTMQVGQTPTLTLPSVTGQAALGSAVSVMADNGSVIASGTLAAPPTIPTLGSGHVGLRFALATTAWGYGTLIGAEPSVMSAWTDVITVPVGTADYTVTTDAEWATVMALPTATLESKVVDVAGPLGYVSLTGKAMTSGLTIRGATGGSITHIRLYGTLTKVTFSGVKFQMTGWPKSYDDIVHIDGGDFDNLVFSGCTFRHGYGPTLANFDPTAQYPEYNRVDNVHTATTTSATYALSWQDATATLGWIEFFNRGTQKVSVDVGGSSVSVPFGGGINFGTTAAPQYYVKPGEKGRAGGLNPSIHSHVAIISETGTSETNARAEVGMLKYMGDAFGSSGSANIGRLEIRGCTFRDLGNAVKGIGKPITLIIMDNDIDRIYGDIMSVSQGNGGSTYVLRNLLSRPAARSGIAENLNGDAGDPHGDLFQMMGLSTGAFVLGNIYSAGNRPRRHARRDGCVAQGLFISDNNVVPSYDGIYSVSDMLIGGATNGVSSGEAAYPAGDILVWGATVLNPADLAGGVSAVRLTTVAEGRAHIGKTVAQAFTKEAAGAGFVRDDCLLISSAASPAALFPSISGLATAATRAEIETAMTSAAEATGLGAVATAGAVDWTTTDHTAVIKWDQVGSGVGWEDITGQAVGATITLPLRKVLNKRTNQTIVPGSGVEWRATASDGTTEVQAWTSASGTVQPGQWVQIRAASSTSELTATNFDVTINGFLARTVVTTGAIIPTVYFTTVGTGPYFVDPANATPANTTIMEFEAKIYLASLPSSEAKIFTQESSGVDLAVLSSGQMRLSVEDGAGTSMIAAGSTGSNVGTLSAGVWTKINLVVDQVAGTAVVKVNNVATFSGSFTAAAQYFQTGREISFLGTTAGANLMPSGARVEYVRAYYTTSGTRSLRKQVAGNAATVNADSWKLGGNAV